MSKGLIVGLVSAALCLLFVLGIFGYAVGFNNNCVAKEQGIIAQYSQNQNNYDNYWKKLKEAAQVPEAYTEKLKTIYSAAMQGRYGSDGSKAAFQMIQEQNPNVDPSMYRQIQQIIEAGRDSFMADQKSLLDKKRDYQTYIGQFPGSLVAGFAGWPKIDLSKYDIVTSETTEQTFKTKKADQIDVFGKQPSKVE